MGDNQSWVLLAAFACFIIVSGLFSIFRPRTMWFLSEGWKFKNAEPSGCSLVVIRIGGLLGIIVGTVLLSIARVLIVSAH